MKYKHIILTGFFAIGALESKGLAEMPEDSNRSLSRYSNFREELSLRKEGVGQCEVRQLKTKPPRSSLGQFVYNHPVATGVTLVAVAGLTYKSWPYIQKTVWPLVTGKLQETSLKAVSNVSQGVVKGVVKVDNFYETTLLPSAAKGVGKLGTLVNEHLIEGAAKIATTTSTIARQGIDAGLAFVDRVLNTIGSILSQGFSKIGASLSFKGQTL